jgi:hypothetical protein
LSKKVTTADFIRRGREVHGDKYDYTKVIYSTAKVKIEIYCPTHGTFLQTPSDHLSGCGCPGCAAISKANNRRLPASSFIARAKAIFGDQYDYSMVEYLGLRKKVSIICSGHGIFQMTPGTHLKGRRCPKCTGREFIPTDEFVSRAKNIHDNRYDYSLVDCEHNRKVVKIICPEHGIFEQVPRSHLMGRGCDQCASVKRGLKKRFNAAEQFLEKARKVHGDLYDYSLSQYKQNRVNITIGCSVHGYFLQTPANHLIGRGCPSCSPTGFDPTQKAILYYLAVLTDRNETLYKIGITNRTVQKRYPIEDLSRIREIKIWSFDNGAEAAEREGLILKEFIHDFYSGPDVLVGGGNTELFVRDVLGLDSAEE